jgi:hypothetical protein
MLINREKLMKKFPLLLSTLLLTACNTTPSNDPASLSFDIPSGSTLRLNKKLDIQAEYTHALIQAGKQMAENDINEYEINCRFDVNSFGPRTINPETFTIRRTEDDSEWFSYMFIMRFYTIMYLDSDKGTDVIKVECQRWGDGIDNNFTVSEMADALGDYFSFDFKQNQ